MEIKKPEDMGPYTEMVEQLYSKATSPVAKAELERMKRLVTGKETETKSESMRKLGLHRRWGA